MRHLSRAVGFVVTVTQVAEEHEVTYPAAALAYYAFVSQIPILILVVALLRDRLLSQARTTLPTFLTPDAQQLISESLATASGQTGAALLAVGVLAWSGANIVLALQTVIERVEHGTEDSFLTQLCHAGSILGSLGLVILSLILTNLVYILLPIGRVLAYSEPLVQVCTLTVAFLPLYYVPSRVVTSPTGALPGALTAAAGCTALLTAIELYAANAAGYALYGVLSGIMIILTSLYLAGVVLMLGIVVNTVTVDTDNIADSSQI